MCDPGFGGGGGWELKTTPVPFSRGLMASPIFSTELHNIASVLPKFGIFRPRFSKRQRLEARGRIHTEFGHL
jgi:hypothetical protein